MFVIKTIYSNLQRSNKHMDAKLKALKARNEYILSMDSANAAIHKYFVEDLSDIVDVSSDYGVPFIVMLTFLRILSSL